MTSPAEGFPQEYPLPVVAHDTVTDVLRYGAAHESSEAAIDEMFAHAQACNPEAVMEVGEMLKHSGYTDPESKEAAKVSLGVTHALLHAQARVDRGLPAVDMSDPEYYLPVVTEDAVSAMLAGEQERLEAAGRTSFEDLAALNENVPRTLGVLGLPVGRGAYAPQYVQAGEIAAVAFHSMLREQAAIDAMHQQWGDEPLG